MRGEHNKVSNEEFQKRLSLLNNGIHTDDEYKNVNTHMDFYCKLNHKFIATPNNVLRGKGCPYCSNKKILVGFNDMWTTRPDMAENLSDPEDGYKYTSCSGQRVMWECKDCHHQHVRQISNVYQRGYRCPICSDGISIPNKYMASLLDDANIDYIPEYHYDGSLYRYDFYIPSLNWIIEMHGRQHYEDWNWGSFGLKANQENDCNKELFAKNNGINEYIIIDCRDSIFAFMTKNIKNSLLSTILVNVDYEQSFIRSCNSKLIQACELYSNGNKTSDIVKILKSNKKTIVTWLKEGTDLGLCNWVPDKGCVYEPKQVVLVNTGELFNSISDASKKYSSCDVRNISDCCRRKRKYCGILDNKGMIWRFVNDYDKNEDFDFSLNPRTQKKKDGEIRPKRKDVISTNKRLSCELYDKGMSLEEISCKLNIKIPTIRSYLRDGVSIGICHTYHPYTKRTHIRKDEVDNRVLCLDSNLIFKNARETSEYYSIDESSISKCCRNEKDATAGLHFTKMCNFTGKIGEPNYDIKANKNPSTPRKVIVLYKNDNSEKIFNSIADVAKKLEIGESTVRNNMNVDRYVFDKYKFFDVAS